MIGWPNHRVEATAVCAVVPGMAFGAAVPHPGRSADGVICRVGGGQSRNTQVANDSFVPRTSPWGVLTPCTNLLCSQEVKLWFSSAARRSMVHGSLSVSSGNRAPAATAVASRAAAEPFGRVNRTKLAVSFWS
jgi:hypothetical protein